MGGGESKMTDLNFSLLVVTLNVNDNQKTEIDRMDKQHKPIISVHNT